MRWQPPLPLSPNLRLLQLPGAGFDGIDFTAVPAACTSCNVHEHETGIAEYTLAAMLEWTIGLGAMNRAFKVGSWAASLTRMGPTRGELAGKDRGDPRLRPHRPRGGTPGARVRYANHRHPAHGARG